MTNKEISKLLRNISAVYQLSNESRFRIIAYEKASEVIENSAVEMSDLWKQGKLTSVPGVGQSIASYLGELFQTGKVIHFDKLFDKFSPALFPLLDVAGFGPKKALKLATELKLNNPETVISDVHKAALSGKIAKIKGFGDKSQQDIIEAIKRYKIGQDKTLRMSVYYANQIAKSVIAYLMQCKYTVDAILLGSLRRMVSTIGDVDIAVKTHDSSKVIEWFIRYPSKVKIIEQGSSGASILLTNQTQVDLRTIDPQRFGSMLQYFTGSKYHNIHLREHALKKGLSLSEYGIKQLNMGKIQSLKKGIYNSDKNIYEYKSEYDYYHDLGMQFIPPELRENTGEIEASIINKLPKLVETKDIKGDLHIHSNYDLETSHDLGNSSLKEIVSRAEKLGYEYLGISDHNPSMANHSNDEIINILKRRKNIFEHIMSSTKSTRVYLFIMLEVDVLPDGKLAIPNEALPYLDALIVSIHSSFNMDKNNMTKRIISALSHPKAKIFAHPSGRRLGKREGYDVDWDKLFNFSIQNNKAIEINSNPERLDLSDILVREATREHVKLVINTDSHDVTHMDYMSLGVSVARRGWAQKSDIINTLSCDKFKKWLLNS